MLCGRSTGATLLRTRSTVSGVESESGVGGEGIGTRLLLMMRMGNLDSSLIEDQFGAFGCCASLSACLYLGDVVLRLNIHTYVCGEFEESYVSGARRMQMKFIAM